MKIKYSYQDYLFISSRIRAMETGFLSRETLNSLAQARSLAELYGILENNGLSSITGGDGEKSFERGLRGRLDVAYLDIIGSVPTPELFTVFTYPYDCINLKSAIKCAEKGTAADGLLLPYGTVSLENVKEAVLKRDFSVFPKMMADAAKKATEVFAKTRSPQEIDLIIDCALYSDMKSSVGNNPLEFFRRLLEIKADTVNILSSLRIIKMGGGCELFEKAYVDGGSIELSAFIRAFETGLESLNESLCASRYEGFREILLKKEVNFTVAEGIAENIFFDHIKTARNVQAGAEVVAGYIAAVEAEVKNIRILITGKKLSISSERLFGMLRKNYV